MGEFRLYSIVIDCKDANALADFYAALLGWEKYTDNPEWISVGRKLETPFLLFQQDENYRPPVWPDRPDRQQKSIHLDFAVSDLEKAIQHAVECGAKVAPEQFSSHWTVMIDPASHPFCLFEKTAEN